jgi:hypothetical protein
VTFLMLAGYISIREAAKSVERAMFAGVKDNPAVTKFRESGFEVGDRTANHRATSELWRAVDASKLRLMAIGGHPRRIVRITAEQTKQVPFVRDPRCGSFSYLRPFNAFHSEFAALFGTNTAAVTLAFRENEVEKLARALMHARRRKLRSGDAKKPRGRPSRQTSAAAIIREIICQESWSPEKSLKELTLQVNRRAKFFPVFSEDTVTRALDGPHGGTKDRRFDRIARKHR